MKISPSSDVLKMYEETADSYAEMMSAEIDLPIYTDVLGRLADRLRGTEGPLVDTACGSGHMLSMYHDRFDPRRPLIGSDLSPRMVEIAGKQVGAHGSIVVGDMRKLPHVGDGIAAALMNFFALHHLEVADAQAAFREWHRVLQPGGQLVVAAWEGSGPIDYGDEADIVAFRYSIPEMKKWTESAGFEVTRCVVEPVEDFPMDAIYLEGERR